MRLAVVLGAMASNCVGGAQLSQAVHVTPLP
jgi:hypothetical protein